MLPYAGSVSAEGGAISGATAFDLWETSGFPLDLTQLMAEEDGLAVDVPGYEVAMEAAREKSRAGEARCMRDWSRPEVMLSAPITSSIMHAARRGHRCCHVIIRNEECTIRAFGCARMHGCALGGSRLWCHQLRADLCKQDRDDHCRALQECQWWWWWPCPCAFSPARCSLCLADLHLCRSLRRPPPPLLFLKRTAAVTFMLPHKQVSARNLSYCLDQRQSSLTDEVSLSR